MRSKGQYAEREFAWCFEQTLGLCKIVTNVVYNNRQHCRGEFCSLKWCGQQRRKRRKACEGRALEIRKELCDAPDKAEQGQKSLVFIRHNTISVNRTYYQR